jgi:hypothetical protein
MKSTLWQLLILAAGFSSELAVGREITPPPAQASTAPDTDQQSWKYLDNGQVRVGVRVDMGAGIAWLSASGAKVNLLDHYDHGRLVQQSWYGKKDGSLWVDKPWASARKSLHSNTIQPVSRPRSDRGIGPVGSCSASAK